ncbi:MAG: hypothetical protein LBJ37_21830 [Paucimonas sp.]|jgi:general secretion pathway protein K|nr:hypothetical protein [Paucimonas sp.]
MLISCARQRGMALMLVLWLLAALSLVVAGVVATQRIEGRQGHGELQRSQALLAAEGGVALVVNELLRNPDHYVANGQHYPVTLDGVTLALSIRSEHGKLDLNFGNLDYFARFFRAMGASANDADRWASQMRERRDLGEPLHHFEDLLTVTSMDTVLYKRILPYLTLWGGDGVPVGAYADPVLSQALDLPKEQMLAGNPGSVVGIDVQATLADGFVAGLMTTVLLMPEGSNGEVFRVLKWHER